MSTLSAKKNLNMGGLSLTNSRTLPWIITNPENDTRVCVTMNKKRVFFDWAAMVKYGYICTALFCQKSKFYISIFFILKKCHGI
jgi:hypothetical protein